MMKKNIVKYCPHLLYAALFLQLLLSSCTDQMDMIFGTPIQLSIPVEDVTRSSVSAGTNIQNSNFDAGTTINGYFCITGGEALGNTPTILTTSAVSGGKQRLTPDQQVYYPNSAGTTVDITAFYPPTKVTNESTSFTVESDQTTDANYKLSDLMYAEVLGQNRTDNDVNLTFNHKMAKVIVNATSEEGVTITKIRLLNVKRTTNMQAGNGVITDLGETADQIILATNIDGTTSLSGAALLPEQTIAADFIEVSLKYNYGAANTLKEGTTVFSLYGKTFEKGKEYTANITITRQCIDNTTTITDWEADEGVVSVIPGSNSVLFIRNVDAQTYTGSPITPAPEITYTVNSIPHEVTEGVDYNLQYFNNTQIGTATIIISGISTSQYEPMQKLMALKSFEIVPKEGNLKYTESEKTVDYVYGLTINNPLISKTEGDDLKRDGAFSYQSSDESVATVSNTGLVTVQGHGDCTITASMDDSGNFTACTASFNLHVIERDASNLTITLYPTSFDYNGQKRIPSIVVTDGGRTLKAGDDYTCDTATDITNNINRGTATVTIHGTGNYKNTGTKTFEITQATPVITMTSDDVVTLAKGFTITRAATTTLGTVVLSSSASNKASVTQDGVVTALAAADNITITATVTTDNADQTKANYKTVSKSYTVNVKEPDKTFSYTGAVQSWTCPVDGTYKLEVWGAQGGSARDFGGGRGAYIAGNLYLTVGQTLYVYVGGAGQRFNNKSADQGGWNGGGTYSGNYTYDSTVITDPFNAMTFCSGGGATDFSLENGAWNSDTHLKSRILVAGGGGGALHYYISSTQGTYGSGGNGGALNGETGLAGNNPGGGGTVSAAGAAGGTNGAAGGFGYGGGYSGVASAGMGGGGWYGGGSGGDASTETTQGAGGGGSSYVWCAEYASQYSNKRSSVTTDYYIDPTSMTVGARSGDGQAQITYISQEHE